MPQLSLNSSAVTLQINFCAGDAAYAELMVPHLIRAHPGVAHRLAVVDCCRPQRTRIYDPDTRLPEKVFAPRLAHIRELVLQFQRAGLFDEIVWLEPGSPHFRPLARRYARPWMTETHDYGGCAFMGYWAALEFPRTRFVLHYDADVCLHQDAGFDWIGAALELWEKYPQVLAASPRISPPGFAGRPEDDAPSRHEGRPLEPVPGGWLNDWFSTRCFLFARERLAPELPLVTGRRTAEYFLRRLIGRGYPIGPELLLFRVLAPRGFRRLNLGSARAWILHPHTKPPAYLAILPQILARVETGRVPSAQLGYSEIDVPAWTEFVASSSASRP